ncbi:MAG: hypothetical protein V4721_07350, partial [Bacteroidota bacterium]
MAGFPMVIIANPLYDTVFKYMMEDNRVARLLIGAIIGRKILEIKCNPQERTIHIDKGLGQQLTVYRLDFTAKVQTDTGEKLLLIELQKTKYPMDIIRFRRYIGDQYRSSEVSYFDPKTNQHIPPEIVSIYLLGYRLETITAPVVQINRVIRDGATKDLIDIKDVFIDSLTHECYIVQIPYLRQRRRNEVEQILSIFDQDQQTQDHHILNVNEEDFPEEYRPIIRRLQQASAEKKVREQMVAEDEVLEDIKHFERVIAEQAAELAEKDAILAEKEKIIAELMAKLNT